VPSRLIRQEVEARITDTTIEIFHKGNRIASHLRSRLRNRHTTILQHMPSAHRRYAEWTPSRMMRHAVGVWLKTGANLLLFGPPGAGKSHLSAAIGLALVENGWRVLFARTTDLVQRLQVAGVS
jgi:DNA replication protein DnaC